MAWVFWSAIALVAFAYAGYPLLMAALAAMRRRPVDAVDWPASVAVLVVVHNAAALLEPKVENLLALDYPPELLRVHLVLDGCTDGTAGAARRLAQASPRVRVHEFDERQGKSACIGRALPLLDSDVVLFTDVRQMLDRNAARALVAALNDSQVGAASGELMLEADTGYGKGIDAYWRYEKLIRRLESASGSLIGVTGAIYAARRSVLPEVPPGVILDDMWIPLSIAQAGHRVVFVPEAIARDRAATDRAAEETRKRRTLMGNYQLLHRWPALAIPGGHRLVWRLWGHKWLRLLAPWLLLLALVASATLALAGSTLYLTLLLMQATAYAIALASLTVPRIAAASRLARFAGAFLSLNLSALLALTDYLRNPNAHLWQVTQCREFSR